MTKCKRLECYNVVAQGRSKYCSEGCMRLVQKESIISHHKQKGGTGRPVGRPQGATKEQELAGYRPAWAVAMTSVTVDMPLRWQSLPVGGPFERRVQAMLDFRLGQA